MTTTADRLENAIQIAVGMALKHEGQAETFRRLEDDWNHGFEMGTVAAYRAMIGSLRPILSEMREADESHALLMRYTLEDDDGTQWEPVLDDEMKGGEINGGAQGDPEAQG